ncbi:MAG: hypothetical protein Kow0037_13460 [Calditrichia bacterium]
MEKIYLSFLGLGQLNKNTGTYAYQPARYGLNGQTSRLTPFVQSAELELLRPLQFDRVIIASTAKGFQIQFPLLEKELAELGYPTPLRVEIPDSFRPQDQWTWFERILPHIPADAELHVDLTHGFRAMPIIISAAIHFLVKSRRVRLQGVYYGAFEARDEIKPIVNMQQFYLIQDLAEGVSRMVDNSDLSQLLEALEKAPENKFLLLNRKDVQKHLKAFADSLNRMDLEGLASHAPRALQTLSKLSGQGGAISQIIVELMLDKFQMQVEAVRPGELTAPYFRTQLELAEILLKDRMYAKAFTILREIVGQFSYLLLTEEMAGESNGRFLLSNVFLSMIRFPRKKWKFEARLQPYRRHLEPLYERFEQLGLVEILRKEMELEKVMEYRNGFAHGWQSIQYPGETELDELGRKACGCLRRVVARLVEDGTLAEA